MSNRTALTRFQIRENDTDDTIQDTLQDEEGNAVDISGGTVKFFMEDGEGTVKVNSSASFTTDGTDGKVQYEWSSGDTDTPGWYKGTWEVTYGDSDIETFPTSDEKQYILVRVEPETA